jgi:hypothetical protein
MASPTLREAPILLCHLIQHVLRKYKLDINLARLRIDDSIVLKYAVLFFNCAPVLFSPDVMHCVHVNVGVGHHGKYDINTEGCLDTHMGPVYADMIAKSVKVDAVMQVMPLETDQSIRDVLIRMHQDQRHHIRIETLSPAASSAFRMLQAFHPLCAHEFAVKSGCLTAVRHFADARDCIEMEITGAYRQLPTIPAHPEVANEASTTYARRVPLQAAHGPIQHRTLLSCGRHTTSHRWRFCPLCDKRHFTKELPLRKTDASPTVVVTDDELIFECLREALIVYPTLCTHMLHTMPNITETYETLILICSGDAETARCGALSKMLFSPQYIYSIADRGC